MLVWDSAGTNTQRHTLRRGDEGKKKGGQSPTFSAHLVAVEFHQTTHSILNEELMVLGGEVESLAGRRGEKRPEEKAWGRMQ